LYNEHLKYNWGY